MKSKLMPLPGRSGTAIVELAQEIERLKDADPAHHGRIMRKLAELEQRAKKLERRSNF